jgi:protein gp37
MGAKSSIEWTEATWNPTTGCDRVSTGCDHCYALRLAGRLKRMGSGKYQNDGDPRTSGPGFAVTLHPEALSIPLTWSTPRMIFVDSMSDLFHARVPVSFVREVFDVIASTPQHTYQLLTKRARRLSMYADALEWPPNLWVGVSVENSEQLHRIEDLKKVPATIRFLSCEPLLDSLEGLTLTGIDWVIVGGESGPDARPVDAEWIKAIRDQAVRAEVPFFFKQWGGRTAKSGGRTIDGRTWEEYPKHAYRLSDRNGRL